MLQKMTKTQVIAHVKKTGTWEGYLVGCNVALWHIRNGWCLGYYTELFMDETRGVCVVGQETCELDPNTDRYDHFPRKFQDLIDNWTWYNANSETGTYAAYYMVK